MLGTAATAGAAALFGGVAGLLVAVAGLATTLSGELLGLVQARSRALRDELLARLASVRSQHADETVDARSHDPFAHVARMLSEYEPTAERVTRALRALEERLERVDGALSQHARAASRVEHDRASPSSSAVSPASPSRARA